MWNFRSIKDLILLLNSDVVLTTGYFKNQFHHFSKSDTFGVKVKLLLLIQIFGYKCYYEYLATVFSL